MNLDHAEAVAARVNKSVTRGFAAWCAEGLWPSGICFDGILGLGPWCEAQPRWTKI